MAAANVNTTAEDKTQARACPCGNKISGGDTHQMCVLCLGLRHAQAAFESTEECSHCGRFSLKVLRRRLARLTNLSSSDPVLTSTAVAPEPMYIPETVAPGASWGDQLDVTDPLPPELGEPGFTALPPECLVQEADDDSDGESELLMSDEDDDDDSSLALSGRVAKPQRQPQRVPTTHLPPCWIWTCKTCANAPMPSSRSNGPRSKRKWRGPITTEKGCPK